VRGELQRPVSIRSIIIPLPQYYQSNCLLYALELHGTAVRSQIIQGLAVAVDAGWAIGGRFYQTFGINRRG